MADPDRKIWEDMLAHLRQHHPAVCRNWFGTLEPLGVADGSVLLRVPDELHREYLRRACLEAFNDAARTATSSLAPVRFLGANDPPPERLDMKSSGTVSARAAGKTGSSSLQRATAGREADRGPGRIERGDARNNQETKSGDVRSASIDSSLPSKPSAIPAGPSNRATSYSDGHVDNNVDNKVDDHAGSHGASHERTVVQHQSAERRRDSSRDDSVFGSPRTMEPSSGVSHGSVLGPGRGIDDQNRGTDRPRHHYGSEADLARGHETLTISPDYGFDTFIVGPTNRLSHAAANAVATDPGHAYNPFFVHGGVGLGKTHLLQAICGALLSRRPETVIHYISCDGFINDFMNSVQRGKMSDFRHRFRDVDILVIDDIHFLANRDRTQEEFFHTFNSLYQDRKQIVLSSDAPPEEIPDLEDRLVSRFNWGLVTKIDPPSYETRVAILHSKAVLRNVELPDPVACFVAERINTNIRELEGAIVKLQIMATVEARPIDLEMAHDALGAPEPVAKRDPSLDDIISSACSFFEVKRTELLGKRRHQSISLPRQICMYLARQHTRHSLEEIGGHFGGRDHSTVLHAVRSVKGRKEADRDLAAAINALEATISDAASGRSR